MSEIVNSNISAVRWIGVASTVIRHLDGALRAHTAEPLPAGVYRSAERFLNDILKGIPELTATNRGLAPLQVDLRNLTIAFEILGDGTSGPSASYDQVRAKVEACRSCLGSIQKKVAPSEPALTATRDFFQGLLDQGNRVRYAEHVRDESPFSARH